MDKKKKKEKEKEKETELNRRCDVGQGESYEGGHVTWQISSATYKVTSEFL